jgi:formylglycine-generating enzyme
LFFSEKGHFFQLFRIMMKKSMSCLKLNCVGIILVFTVFSASIHADTIIHGSTAINMDFVTVGNADNNADTTGNPNPCGAVAYSYRIGQYEVSAEQWAAVIAADINVGDAGYWSGLQPTAGASWNEAAMFCNWLTTGDANSGYYDINAGVAQPNALAHDVYAALHGLTFFIPTEDEWYKAAYYDGNADKYYSYPTGSSNIPDGINSADDTTFDAVFNDGYSLSEPKAINDTGLASPYGTVGQGGNVWEWNETAIGSSRGLRGGSFYLSTSSTLLASTRNSYTPTEEFASIGFRVACIPEPCNITMLAGFVAMSLLYRWKSGSRQLGKQRHNSC